VEKTNFRRKTIVQTLSRVAVGHSAAAAAAVTGAGLSATRSGRSDASGADAVAARQRRPLQLNRRRVA